MKKIILYFSKTLVVSILLVSCAKKETLPTSWNVLSPDNVIQATIKLDETTGKLSYIVLSGSDTILKPSPLGISRDDQSFIEGLALAEASPMSVINETYTMMTGKRKVNLNNANELTLTFNNKAKSELQVVFRAYNEGVAFRYNFPETDANLHTLTGEATGFSVPTDGKSWIQGYDLPNDWGPAYEAFYTFGTAIGAPSPDTTGWGFPALFNTQNNWTLITEAGLEGSYCATHLNQNCDNGLYTVRFPSQLEGKGLFNALPSSTLPWATPWRVIITGKSVGTIIESNLVHHLAPAQVAGDFSWVKPGRASWSWWGEHDSPKDFKRLKAYIDFASSVGWEYCLIDANWDLMTNGGNIQELAKYATSKSVSLLLWYNSGGPHNVVTERPRDIMNDPIKRKEEFKKIKSWGVAGVKVDFFDSDKQALIQEFLDILKDAADNQILVDFHGCTLPRGWARTYPNLMSMEGIKGAEQYGWDKNFARLAASHNTVVVATRNVVGSMDYTPMTFSDYDCCKHPTTNAHELALSVVFESGIVHWADRVDSYLKQSAQIKAYMKIAPATWDETKFVAGEPNKLMVLARKKEDSWFVAGINGDSTVKEMNIELPFISEGKYKMTIYADGASNRVIDVKEMEFVSGTKIPVKMLPKGGFTAWIRK